MANLSNINNKFLVTTTGEVLIGQTANNGNRLQITGADGASYIYLKTDVATTGGRIGFNGDDLRVFNQQASGELQLGTAGTSRVRISNSLVVFPTITELRGDVAAKFAIGNMGGASSQMMVSSRGFLTFNVSNTGSALDATERMRIDSSGNVTVYNDFTIDNSSPEFYMTTGSTHHNWRVAAQEVVNEGFEIASQPAAGGAYTNHLVILGTSGNVGIGTDSPGDILEVFAPGNGDGILIQSDPAGVNRAPALHLNPTAASADGRNWAISPFRDVAQSLSFSSSNAKGGDAYAVATTRMIIDGISGNVGINNTSPGSKLTVNGNANGSAEYSTTLGSNASATGAANSANTSPVNKTYLTGYGIPYSGNTNARLTTCGFLEFASTPGWTGNQRIWAITSGYDIGGSDSGAGGNKMAIILGNSQNVSPNIGTNGAIGEAGDGDGANSLVACYWDNSLNMRLANSSRLYTGAGGSAALPMITPGTDKNTGIWYPANDTWAVSTAGTERMRITGGGEIKAKPATSGRAFFSTQDPGNFSIAYTAYMVNASTKVLDILWYGSTIGSITTNSSGTGVDYNTTSSDERLKKNITNWDENILDKFKDIKPKEFNFNTQDNSEEKIKGYIAQNEVDKFPEAYPLVYNEEAKEDRHLFNPSGMTVYLMKAIQELKAEIELLKSK